MSLLVVGSMAYDSIETPHGRREEILGGSASYFSLAASLFTRVRLVAAVGEDFRHASVLERPSIDLSGLIRMEGKTFRWAGAYRGAMNDAETLRTELNVMERYSPVIPEPFRASEYVFLANIDPLIQAATLRDLKGPRVVACDTMNFWIKGSRAALVALLPRVGIFVINETEARMLSGEQNIVKAARGVQALGPRVVVVKRGEYGALVLSGEELFALPGLPLETVKDPTGAGDSFAGGFMGYLAGTSSRLDSEALRRAVVYGSVAASFAVEDFGVERLLSLRRADLDERYRRFVSLTRIPDPAGP